MLGGLLKQAHPDTADTLVTVSRSISRTLVILRLLDDIPALSHTMLQFRPQKVLPPARIINSLVSRHRAGPAHIVMVVTQDKE